MDKKKLGIIGGMGSRAGAWFFGKIVDYSPAICDQDFLEIIFHNNSIVPDRTRAIVYNGPSPLDSLLRSVKLFNANRVEVIAMSCITAYYYYAEICTHTPARVLNPLDLVADEIEKCCSSGIRIGILATTGTISSGLFHRALEPLGVEIVTLDPESQENLFMQAVYMESGFKSAVISAEAGGLMNECVRKMKEARVDLVIGGCTEVSIAVERIRIDIPYLDTLDLLARKTVEYCYS